MSRILAIETSCDETAVSIVDVQNDRLKIQAHQVFSQTSHDVFGGVVPEIAARDHLSKINEVYTNALTQASVTLNEVDILAVTLGPGLIGALMVGVLFARGLARATNKPLIGINHVDAHLAPALLCPKFELGTWLQRPEITFPALALTISGGHCLLSYLKSPTDRRIIGKTADDACGEAFDKVAKVLSLPYPGGPHVEKLANQVQASRYQFPSILQDKSNRTGFSYSGIKTAVLNEVNKAKNSGSMPNDFFAEIAFAFQKAALGQLIDRIKNSLHDFPEINSLIVAGGVAANQYLRHELTQLNIPLFFAPTVLCSDNATMIAMHAALIQTDGFVEQPFARYPYES